MVWVKLFGPDYRHTYPAKLMIIWSKGHENCHAMCDLRDDLEIETIFSELRSAFILN